MARRNKKGGDCNNSGVAGTAEQPPDIDRFRREVAQRMLEELKDAEVRVPEIWRRGIDPEIIYPGECFYRSYLYVKDLALRLDPCDHTVIPRLWLVHGEYLGWQRHGWVELPRGVVFDGVLQRFYRKRAYYEIQYARPWYKYAPSAAFVIARNMPAQADGLFPYGEWHAHLKLPWADPARPTVVDSERALELLVTSGLRPDLARYLKPARAKK
jgi:hypothetical protein